jgi:hypothetical protein
MVSEQSVLFFYFGFRRVLALTEQASYLTVRDDHIPADPRIHVNNQLPYTNHHPTN